MGNLTERTTTAGECYHYSYDCLARITSIENPAGGVAYFTYDALGRVTKAEDEKGNITCYEYTPNGNLAKVTDALGNETFISMMQWDSWYRQAVQEPMGKNHRYSLYLG